MNIPKLAFVQTRNFKFNRLTFAPLETRQNYYSDLDSQSRGKRIKSALRILYSGLADCLLVHAEMYIKSLLILTAFDQHRAGIYFSHIKYVTIPEEHNLNITINSQMKKLSEVHIGQKHCMI